MKEAGGAAWSREGGELVIDVVADRDPPAEVRKLASGNLWAVIGAAATGGIVWLGGARWPVVLVAAAAGGLGGAAAANVYNGRGIL